MGWRGTIATSTAGDLLVVASYIGTAFIRVQAVPALRIAVVDVLLALALFVGCRYLRHGNPASDLLGKVMPWAFLYVSANFLALLSIGLTVWAVDQLTRDLFVMAVFFTFAAYFFERPAARRLMWLMVPVMAVWLSITTVVGTSDVRQGGFFDNPNYAAHFIMAALVCVLAGDYSRRLKVVVLVLTIPGALATGSFASFVFAGAVGLYTIWWWIGRFSLQIKTVTRIALVCALPLLVMAGWGRFQQVEEAGGSVGNVDTARFDRSSGVRTRIWQEAIHIAIEHPLGIGNGGFVMRTDVVPAVEGVGHAEVHNDYIAILVESGLLGLVGIGGVVVLIWRAGRPHGPTRLLLVGLLATGLTREVINFRHSWVLLALVLATEWATPRPAPSPALGGVRWRHQGALAPRHGA
jgi:O-antigen ligase